MHSLLNLLAAPGIVGARRLSSSKSATPYIDSKLEKSSEQPRAEWCRVSKAGPILPLMDEVHVAR